MGRPRRSYTDEDKAAALALYAEQGPAEVERQMGIPKATVCNWGRAAGVETVRNERTAAAVEAVKVDAAARKAGLVDKLLRLADAALDVELAKLVGSDLRDVVGARTRAIHDLQLLSGEATGRTEVTERGASIDDEVKRLAAQLGLVESRDE